MKVIILAGGKGTRLPKSASDKPKPLVEVGGKTILDRQIEHLENQGFSDLRFSLGHMADQVIEHLKENYGGKYDWVVEPEKLGTGGGLKYASRDVDDDFLAFNVDDLADIDHQELASFHGGHEHPATISTFNIDDARDFGLVDVDESEMPKIRGFSEKPEEKRPGEISIGTYVLDPKIFDLIDDDKFSIEYDLFPTLARQGDLAAFRHKGDWKTVGTEERLERARRNGLPI